MSLKTASGIRVIVPLAGTNLSLVDVLGFGGALKDMARKLGGKGRVFRGPDVVQIDLEGILYEQLDPLVSAYGESLKKGAYRCDIVTVPAKPCPFAGIIPGEYLRERLTKKLFFGLPAGASVVSNLSAGPSGASSWIAHLTVRADRERLWEQAVAKGVAHRMASVVWSQADCALLQSRHIRPQNIPLA